MKILIITAIVIIFISGMAYAQLNTPYQNQNLWNQQQYLRNQQQMLNIMRQQQMNQIGQQMQIHRQNQYNPIQAGLNTLSQVPQYHGPATCFINSL